jgi:hypothetical protein
LLLVVVVPMAEQAILAVAMVAHPMDRTAENITALSEQMLDMALSQPKLETPDLNSMLIQNYHSKEVI